MADPGRGIDFDGHHRQCFFLFDETYAFSDTTISAGGKVGGWLAMGLLKYANITGCAILLFFWCCWALF